MMKKSSGLAIKVQILRTWDLDWYPGWAECVFCDAFGISHFFREKLPVIAEEESIKEKGFPQEGVIRCECLGTKRERDGRILWEITTERPDHVVSIEGNMNFWVAPEQAVEC